MKPHAARRPKSEISFWRWDVEKLMAAQNVESPASRPRIIDLHFFFIFFRSFSRERREIYGRF